MELLTEEALEELQMIRNAAPLKEATREFEQRYIGAILEKTQGNRGKAADLLGIHRSTLALKMQQLDLEPLES